MRYSILTYLAVFTAAGLTITTTYGEPTDEHIELATHNSIDAPAEKDLLAAERIRKIVLNQGDDARALANLVQLARELPKPIASQLYDQLASDYLENGKYNQAANLLQQLVNQFADEQPAHDALLRLVRLYSSSEVQHSENANRSTKTSSGNQQGFSKYALHVATTAIQKDAQLAENVALQFQQSVAMRLDGRGQAALGSLTRLKRNLKANPWRGRALAEQWLIGDREDDAPMATALCVRANSYPTLDGNLDEPFWRGDGPVRFAYNDEFLYLAVQTPKQESLNYAPDTRTRTYDADLSAHDRVVLRLDVDRDYATAYELAVDHRGWTNDRCWLDKSWNLKWFVAAGADHSHWTVEAAIPLESLVARAPSAGNAWAVSWEQLLPDSTANSINATENRPLGDFRLLLFQ